MSGDAEGRLALMIKSIPAEKIPELEDALEELLCKFNLSGTFWSQTVIVKRARKYRRVCGQGGKVKIGGNISE